MARRWFFALVILVVLSAGTLAWIAVRFQRNAPQAQIAFIYRLGDAFGLFTITADGSDRTALVTSVATPGWLERPLGLFPPAQQSLLRPILYGDSLYSPTWFDGSGAIGYRTSKIGETCDGVLQFDLQEEQEQEIGCLETALSDEAFSWAPDGTRYAFAVRQAAFTSIVIANSEGKIMLRRDVTNTVWGMAWGPDSNLLAASVDGRDGLLIFSEAGLRAALPTTAAAYGRPAWSPDGRQIAFLCTDEQQIRVCTLHVDGSGFRQIDFPPEVPYIKKDLQWSPEGSRLAFVAVQPSGFNDIFLIDLESGGVQQLTFDPAGDSDPRWSPDGTAIVFASNRDGNWELYTIRADGTGLTRLTETPGDETEPAWRPFTAEE